MKTKLVMIALLNAIGLSTALSQKGYIVDDDIYFNRNKSVNPIVEERRKESPKDNVATPYSYSESVTSEGGRSVDEYNRQSVGSLNEMTLNQLDSLSKTIEERDVEEGYYLNGFEGSDQDEEYAERIRRFHNPRYTVFVGDPGYNDIYFLNSMDWNVYVDGNYAYVTPTWTNRWYTDFMFSPMSYSSMYWRMGGMHSSWGWGGYPYNYGWNSPWNSGYYGGYWGGGYYSNHHYYGGYYGWGGHYPHYPVTLPSYGSSSSRNYSHGRSSGNATNYGSRGNATAGRSTGAYGRSSGNGGRSSSYGSSSGSNGRSTSSYGRSSGSNGRSTGTYQSTGRSSNYTNVVPSQGSTSRPSQGGSSGSTSVQNGRSRAGSGSGAVNSSSGTYRSSGRSSSTSSGTVNSSSSSSSSIGRSSYESSSSGRTSSSSTYSAPSSSSSSRSTGASSSGRSSSGGGSSSSGRSRR